ncbi:MAG: hypothetical protein LBL82_08215 [Oscillospiraceae bacterium]|jgi:predicted RNA-binding Zn-ribbon protein involved in translation (DUF1610 family)|nr:hypothetical protein [Oscillospiraceae bacterium]
MSKKQKRKSTAQNEQSNSGGGSAAETSSVQYKCPNCDAPLEFDIASQTMKCSSCEMQLPVEEFEKFYEAFNQDTDGFDGYHGEILSEDEIQALSCPSCGGEIIADAITVSTECPFCGNPTIVQSRLSGVLKPDWIIPFKLEKEQAKLELQKFYKGKLFLPRVFKKENQIDKIMGVYVPFWLYDASAVAGATYRANKVTLMIVGEFRYTKTNTYFVSRMASVDFQKIPADGSKKMDDILMESIEPYDYREITDFSMAYLSGYVADKYDVDSEQNQERVNERIIASVSEQLLSTIAGYSGVTTRELKVRIKKSSIKYALFPVWILNTKWRDKKYTFYMNGQTGKISGEVPVDRTLAGLIGGSIFAIIWAIIYCYIIFMCTDIYMPDFSTSIEWGIPFAAVMIAVLAGSLFVKWRNKKSKS